MNGLGLLRQASSNVQLWLVLLAIIATSITFFNPKISRDKNRYNYLFIVDITQSMNTRDYTVPGMPSDRLSFVKQVLNKNLSSFSCGSRMGLGVFSNKEALILFEPIDICKNFPILADAISHLDWRMAWAANSNIRRGLYNSILRAADLPDPPHLVFMTDGEPTIEEYYPAPLERLPKTAKGLIIGIGGHTPAPIPKLDQDNIVADYWRADQIQYSPGRKKDVGKDNYYLSTVDEANLRNLALLTGLQYHRLDTPEDFQQILLADEFATKQPVMTDIRWAFALIAMFFILVSYFVRLGPRSD